MNRPKTYSPGCSILVHSRRNCSIAKYSNERALCGMDFVRRTVWDGSRELYEIQMLADQGEALMEQDAGPIPDINFESSIADPNKFYGRVAYTQGPIVDRPLSITRIGYGDHPEGGTYYELKPFTLVPLWNAQGRAILATFGSGDQRGCDPDKPDRCVEWRGPETWYAYYRDKHELPVWHGTLLDDKLDHAGSAYRRNRYYDPGTGRFTQEDPIGLAGGINLYGFANGDPVNFSDPFGLSTDPPWWRRAATRAATIIKVVTSAAGGAGAATGETPKPPAFQQAVEESASGQTARSGQSTRPSATGGGRPPPAPPGFVNRRIEHPVSLDTRLG